MKRSEINRAYRDAMACFERHHWSLPRNAAWDITDFGLGRFREYGLVLINLAEEPEYCEKLMYARFEQRTPCHTHRRKKEDIICRAGRLGLLLWPGQPNERQILGTVFTAQVDRQPKTVRAGELLVLEAGSRVTLSPGIWHEFFPTTEECIIGEVSTANDDQTDNVFINPEIGRFPEIEEDVPAALRLLSEQR